jgi:hypothetical protein
VDADHRVAGVELAGEQALLLQAVQAPAQGTDVLGDEPLQLGVVFQLGQLQIFLQVAVVRVDLRVGVERILQAGLLGQQAAGALLVVPEFLARGLLLQLGTPLSCRRLRRVPLSLLSSRRSWFVLRSCPR